MIDEMFDRLVDQAWPALGRTAAGGWTLRTAGGVTKRANSVLPLGEREDLEAAVEEAERFYAGRGLPCAFSIGAGATPGLDELLGARGYRVVDPTLVMTAPLAKAVPEGCGDAEAGGGRPAEVRLSAAPAPEWLGVWWSVDGRPGGDVETARRILTGVPAAYASLGGDEGEEAVGRGVTQGEWFGVYCMATLPHARRRGHAGRLLDALLSHGREQGAKQAYLTVVEANTGARSLYERLGFTTVGRYHYRVR
ncbi:GNAT family N-acetyltransferase [Planomonospora sp. ID67723]|uniref:GNAT family N-acetyltransferase n=1 Tax=Planomonospora sp. ID67723 TaxID=2738134 RepID=UPI0018C3550E|nr:GNAT family N-acetyltransferase [Planomonospora sp. ID67723]MBG0830601.1 GNAT family N-acetyltransferase [Planomonospora sp. ID67723]